jgi:hypothetical protein
MEGVAHMQFSFVFLGLVQWIFQHDAHLFSEFAPYSLSIQYCQVEMCFLDISLVPLNVCEGKKFAFISSFCFEFGFAVFLHYILSGPFIHILFSCAKLFMMLLFFVDQ